MKTTSLLTFLVLLPRPVNALFDWFCLIPFLNLFFFWCRVDTNNEPPTTTTGLNPSPPSPTPNPDRYDIYLDMQLPSFPQAESFVRDGAARWEEIITGDVEDVDLRLGSVPSIKHPDCAYPSIVDDLYMCVYADTIDGLGNVVGMGGWNKLRANGMPLLGFAFFDTADIQRLIDNGNMLNVVLHEFGHS